MYQNISAEVQELNDIIRKSMIEQRKAEIIEFKCEQSEREVIREEKHQDYLRRLKQQHDLDSAQQREIYMQIEKQKEQDMMRKTQIKKEFQNEQNMKITNGQEKKRQLYSKQMDETAALMHQRELEEKEHRLRTKERRMRIKEQEKNLKQQKLIAKINKKLEFEDYQNSQLQVLAIRAQKAQELMEESKMKQQESIEQMKDIQFRLQLEQLGKK